VLIGVRLVFDVSSSAGQIQDLHSEWGFKLDIERRHQPTDHSEVADQ
jgi:hypothetical protein